MQKGLDQHEGGWQRCTLISLHQSFQTTQKVGIVVRWRCGCRGCGRTNGQPPDSPPFPTTCHATVQLRIPHRSHPHETLLADKVINLLHVLILMFPGWIGFEYHTWAGFTALLLATMAWASDDERQRYWSRPPQAIGIDLSPNFMFVLLFLNHYVHC
jgi:hypothetical protein